MNPECAHQTKLLLIDDHNLFRSGVRSLLQRYGEFQIVGEASDGTEGVNRTIQLKPDVVLLDLHMPGLSGPETARLILEEVPETYVLILTVSEDAEDLFLALQAGACGYLLKNIEAETLVSAIRTAARGESVISPQMMNKLLAGIRNNHPEESAPVSESNTILEKLTPREREILGFLVQGLSNKEIARQLKLAESTIKIHVQNLLRKLGMSSRVQAAIYAIENGLGSVKN